MGMRAGTAVCLVALVSALPGAARAEEAPGSLGFKLGDNNGRLHPFVDVDGHWVKNPGRLYPTGPSDLITNARLGFDLKFPSDIIELGGDGGISYDKFWGLQNAATASLTTVTGHLSLNATLNKPGFVVVRLYEYLLRSGDPYNQTLSQRLLHTLEIANLWIDIKPGGGALTLTLGSGYYLDVYDRAQASIPTGALDNWRLMPEARLTYKFLPQTGVFIEGNAILTYFNQSTYTAAAAGPTVQVTNIDSRLVNAQAGIAGAVTHRINAMLKAGYGNTFVASGGANLQTAIGAADITFDYSDTGKLAFGAARTIQPASFFRYYAMWHTYVRLQHQVAEHTEFSLSPQFNIYDYGPEIAPTGNARRQDRDIVVEAMITQSLAEWVRLSIVERFDYRLSNFVTTIANAGYLTNDLLLRVEFRY